MQAYIQAADSPRVDPATDLETALHPEDLAIAPFDFGSVTDTILRDLGEVIPTVHHEIGI